MSEKLTAAVARIAALPEDRQEAAAVLLLLDFFEREQVIEFTPEQIDELERYIEEVSPNGW